MKRINLKSKRLRNLIKKAIELSQMCDLDISLVMRDREMNKVTQYCSGFPEDELFTAEDAVKAIEKMKKIEKAIKLYTDNDYKILKTKERSTDKRRRPRPDETSEPTCEPICFDAPPSLPIMVPKIESYDAVKRQCSIQSNLINRNSQYI